MPGGRPAGSSAVQAVRGLPALLQQACVRKRLLEQLFSHTTATLIEIAAVTRQTGPGIRRLMRAYLYLAEAVGAAGV